MTWSGIWTRESLTVIILSSTHRKWHVKKDHRKFSELGYGGNFNLKPISVCHSQSLPRAILPWAHSNGRKQNTGDTTERGKRQWCGFQARTYSSSSSPIARCNLHPFATGAGVSIGSAKKPNTKKSKHGNISLKKGQNGK